MATETATATVVNKGYFVSQLEKTALTLDAFSDTIKTIRSQNVVVKVLDGTSALPNAEHITPDEFTSWLRSMAQQNVRVWAWADIYPDKINTQVTALASRVRTTGINYIVLRPLDRWSVQQARLYITALQTELPKNTVFALANPPYDRDFPLVDFVSVCSVLMPLIPLNTLSGNLRANLTAIKNTYAQYFPDKLLMPVALTTGKVDSDNAFVWRARPDQIDEFLNACTDLEITTVNFLAWQDIRYQPLLWTAIQSWDYQAPQQLLAPTITTQVVRSTSPIATASTTALPSNLTAEEQLHQYGVALGSDQGGTWQDNEINNVLDVTQSIGEALAPLFEALYNESDPIQAFRMLYAPLLVKRNPTINVNPTPNAGVWYGRNALGFVMYYGNKMFISGRESLRTGAGLGFNSYQIIAHEFAHTINFRYPKIASLRGGDLDQYYGNYLQLASYTLSSGESVPLSHVNDGYSFAARSSTHFYETVTDAIANYTYHGLTIGDGYSASDNLKGTARLEQLSTMMTHVIQHRIANYLSLDEMISQITNTFGNSAIDELTPALDALRSADLNARLAHYQGA